MERRDMAKGDRKPGVLLVHDAGSDGSEFEKMASTLQKRGFGVLSIEVRGHGANTQEDIDWGKLDDEGRKAREEIDDDELVARLRLDLFEVALDRLIVDDDDSHSRQKRAVWGEQTRCVRACRHAVPPAPEACRTAPLPTSFRSTLCGAGGLAPPREW